MASGTGNLPNQNMDFTPFDILTAEEMDDLVENIESLADGSGIGDGAIGTNALGQSVVTPDKLQAQTSFVVPGSASDELANNTDWQNTSLSITLPEAGVYEVVANVRAQVQHSSASYMAIRLYNSTDSSAIGDSLILAVYGHANQQGQATSSTRAIVEVSSSKTIIVQAQLGGTGYSNRRVYLNSTSGNSSIMYKKIGYSS